MNSRWYYMRKLFQIHVNLITQQRKHCCEFQDKHYFVEIHFASVIETRRSGCYTTITLP